MLDEFNRLAIILGSIFAVGMFLYYLFLFLWAVFS